MQRAGVGNPSKIAGMDRTWDWFKNILQRTLKTLYAGAGTGEGARTREAAGQHGLFAQYASAGIYRQSFRKNARIHPYGNERFRVVFTKTHVYKFQHRIDLRKYCFTVRKVERGNKLPNMVISAPNGEKLRGLLKGKSTSIKNGHRNRYKVMQKKEK